jgi:hypothetical protein
MRVASRSLRQELVFNRSANLGVTFNGPLARDYSQTPAGIPISSHSRRLSPRR